MEFFKKLGGKKTWCRAALTTIPIILVLIIIAAITTGDSGRNGDNEYEPAFVYTPTTTEPLPPPLLEDPRHTTRWEEDEPEIVDPRPRSLLTGLPIDEEYLNRRPIAVVINNIHVAQPQSGVTSADIIYEVLAEGNITRLVAIFQSYIPEKIGPVRSARDYFVDFAFNHDAIFVHHGTSPTGRTRINSTQVPALDGMSLEGSVFWRDRTYPEWHRNTGTRPLEHSSYAGWERMANHISSRNIRDYIGENPSYSFAFSAPGDSPQVPAAGIAERVVVPFSSTYVRTFVFDPETGLYMVEDQSGPHQDAETMEQIAVANVLIQFTAMQVVDAEGRRNVQTINAAGGHGYLATGGEYRPVRWVKDSHTAPMRWYFEDDTPLLLTPGATWINVIQSGTEITFE